MIKTKNGARAPINEAVNVVSPEILAVVGVKKKWLDIKVDATERIKDQKTKKQQTGGGQGSPDLPRLTIDWR